MNEQYRNALRIENLLSNFPWHIYPEIRPNQLAALEHVAKHGSAVIEMPTGTGKSAVGYTVLKTLSDARLGPLFYITPNKTLVDGVRKLHPDLQVAYGRHEYECLYTSPEAFRADEIPCLSLVDCPHRVDQKTGETMESGALPCPYYQAKYEAKQAKIVLCTASFYLFTQLFSREFDRPAGLVIDEAHRIAQVFRSSLSYEISDWHLKQSIKLLHKLEAPEANGLEIFLDTMVRILRKKPLNSPTLLEDEELLELIWVLEGIDATKLRGRVAEAIQSGMVDPLREMELLKRLENITYDLHRYIHSLEYSLPEEGGRHALNYVTCAYSERGRVEHKLVIRAHYVAHLVKKLLSPLTVAYSATIGDAEIFGIETGIKAPFLSLASPFSAERTRVFLPNNTPNLAQAKRIKAEPTKVLRRIAKACGVIGERGHRSLVVVVSNSEREKFLWLCDQEGVSVLSYGNGTHPKEALTRFKAGEGSVLVGTVANYGEGIDLPGGIASVIFFLRPGYPNPNDPVSQFEERRFGNGQVWRVRNWRVMIEALQVRGRNIRSETDTGATIFVSQHFRRFLFASLPPWLQESYRGDLTLEQGRDEILSLLD